MNLKNCYPKCIDRLLLAGLLSGLIVTGANAAIQVIGVQYQQDNPYPEYQCLYRYGNYPTTCHSTPVGANAHVFLKNTGSSPVTMNDMTLAGYNLNTVIRTTQFNEHYPSSIYLYWDNPETEAPAIMAAGEPVWCRLDPNPIPANGFARAVVRLRSVPTTPTITVGVNTSAGNVTTNITVDANAPVLASVGFSTNRTKVYLHWRRSGGAAPTSVWLDGTNVTALTTTVGDPTMNFAASVIELPAPLPNMSYHVFQGVYSDGKTATGSLRVWVNRFLYGTWGVKDIPDGDTAGVQAWINQCYQRGVNCYVNNSVSALNSYMATAGGQAYAEARDYGYVKDAAWGNNPRMWFIFDEPDLREGTVEANFCGTGLRIPCGGGHTPGILGRRMLELGETLRAKNPSVPTTINLDGNFKPHGWYAYGQLADVMMVDSYHDEVMADRDGTPAAVLFRKPTSVYACAIATTTGAEPNPMHLILYANEYRRSNGDIWPFASPTSKRIQAYYTLAGGAKGMAYWWFKKGYPYNGLDANTPAAQALWNEIGRVGNEIKIAQPLLVTGHPVTVPLTPSTNVWARALASGTDTMIVFAVNDNFYLDQAGTHITAVPNASVTLTLPAWMQPSPTAFEISCGGLKPVATQLNGNQLQIALGTLAVTRMIVLTRNPEIPPMIQQRYQQLVRPNICAFAAESCTNSAPVIVVPPQSQSVLPGSNALFSAVAGGFPFPTYQWRFNGGNLPGATSDTYTRPNAQISDSGNYSVVASNSLGVVTSVVATLTVSTNGFPPNIITPPQSQSVEAGQDATFTVTAGGTEPLRYQWRFNGAHIPGATTNSYTRSNAQPGDAGNYDVVVTNAAGAVTSAVATLTVVIPCPAPGLLNPSFELGNTGGVGANWTGYQRAPNPGITIWSIQTASPPAGAGAQYQQIANTNSAGGAGVRQNITGCVPGATYTISGWMRGNSGLYSTCTVKVSPTASTSWATAIHLNPAQTYTGDTWTPFSGTVVAAGTSMTLWLDGQTTGSGNFKTECFDAVTVTCHGMPAPLRFESVHRPSPNQVSLTVSGPAGVNVTIQSSSNLLNWIPLTNLANPSGTVQFTETMSVNPPRRFYRAISP